MEKEIFKNMKYVLTFESYLLGSRQPLYHATNYALVDILESDILKTSTTADKQKAICLTRSSTYNLDDSVEVRLVLDADKLLNDGYIVTPYDEQGVLGVKYLPKGHNNLSKLTKVNYTWRPPVHNLNLPETDNDDFTWEYEERIYKNIENLGKYLIAIDLTEASYNKYKDALYKYIQKYPHIKLIKLNQSKMWDRNNEY